MENTDDNRRNEIIKQPQTLDEAHEMLNQAESLLNNLTITSPNVSGSVYLGFYFNP